MKEVQFEATAEAIEQIEQEQNFSAESSGFSFASPS